MPALGFTPHTGRVPPDSLTILNCFPQASPLCGPRECSSCGRDPARGDAPSPPAALPDPAAQGPSCPQETLMVAKECQCHRPTEGQSPGFTLLYPSPSSHRLRAVDATVCLVGYQEEVRKTGINGPRGQSPTGEEPGTGQYVGIDL